MKILCADCGSELLFIQKETKDDVRLRNYRVYSCSRCGSKALSKEISSVLTKYAPQEIKDEKQASA